MSNRATAVDRVISENVVRLLHRSGLSARALAVGVGMTQPTLSRRINCLSAWRYVEAVAVADYFGVSHDRIGGQLLDDDDGRDPNPEPSCLGSDSLAVAL